MLALLLAGDVVSWGARAVTTALAKSNATALHPGKRHDRVCRAAKGVFACSPGICRGPQRRRTEGSNLAPSSGESCANLMMDDIELARPHEKIIALLGDGSSMYA